MRDRIRWQALCSPAQNEMEMCGQSLLWLDEKAICEIFIISADLILKDGLYDAKAEAEAEGRGWQLSCTKGNRFCLN